MDDGLGNWNFTGGSGSDGFDALTTGVIVKGCCDRVRGIVTDVRNGRGCVGCEFSLEVENQHFENDRKKS